MKVNITLPIYYDNSDTIRLEELGLKTSINDCEIRGITFYNIDCIGPREFEDGTIEKCTIYSSGIEFISSLSYEEVYLKLKPYADNE